MFNQIVKLNCFSRNKFLKQLASNLLEKLYGCEINCTEIAKSVLFAHRGKGCTIAASKISENVVIFQNVTIGSNMRYHKSSKTWENIGGPVIGKNVIISDGAKILGPIIIGENTVIAAGAIVTKDMPANSVIYGVNQFRPKDPDYDLVYNADMVDFEKIIEANNRLIARALSA